jgi:hypothetical protein
MVAIGVMLGVGTFVSASASAFTVMEWLVNGEVILAGSPVNADILPEGTMLFEDMNSTGKPDLLCELSKTTGKLEDDGVLEIKATECIKPEIDSGTCGSPVISPVHLPWIAVVEEPSEGVFELRVVSGHEGEPGWLVECTVLGIKATDTCTTNKSQMLLQNSEGGVVKAEYMEEVASEEDANCTLGGAEQGLQVGLSVIQALTEGGELLSLAVSSTTEAGNPTEDQAEAEINFGQVSLTLELTLTLLITFNVRSNLFFENTIIKPNLGAFTVVSGASNTCKGFVRALGTCALEVTYTALAPAGTESKETLELEYELLSSRLKGLKDQYQLKGISSP